MKNENSNNKKQVYIRPEDLLEFIIRSMRSWKTLDSIEENLQKMLLYFKEEKFDRLKEEFNL